MNNYIYYKGKLLDRKCFNIKIEWFKSHDRAGLNVMAQR